MNALLLRTLQVPKSPSLLAFSEYREAEQGHRASEAPVLLEYETLELRVHPPNVEIDNEQFDDRTLITLDSANRPGTLVEVVQLLTELGLNVIKARISSDGGWFVDEFHVTDAGKKVTNERKLRAIRKVLSVDYDGDDSVEGSSGGGPDPYDESRQCSTVFELAGDDRIGLLAEVIELLKINGCEVRSAAVWTYHKRVAFVISVLEQSGSGPIKDDLKLARLKQLLKRKMDGEDAPGASAGGAAPSRPAGGGSYVHCQLTKGLIHYERRLHQLLLREEEEQWLRSGLLEQYEREVREAGPQGQGGGGWRSAAAAAPSTPGTSSIASAATRPNGQQQHQMEQQALAAEGAPASAGASTASDASSSPAGASAAPSPLSTADIGCAPSARSPSMPPQPANGPVSDSLLPQRAASTGQWTTLAPSLGPSGAAHGHAHGHAKPEVTLQYYRQCNYWYVSIRCRDRQKLLFDTVCTLADLNYDVYHGAVDCELERPGGTCGGGAGSSSSSGAVSWATQVFYMRPRTGDSAWDPVRAAKLKYMLEAAIQRRHPQGSKVHIQTFEGSGQSDLASLTAVWRSFGLSITRAKVRALGGAPGEHTFYLTDEGGRPPSDTLVQQACQQIGGVRLARADVTASQKAMMARSYKFGFTVTLRSGVWGVATLDGRSPVGSFVGSV